MDTGGQEKYNALNKIYYKRADCCVLVYDITNKKSFDECKNYYKKEIKENCKKNIKVILVGNKTDLENQRKISNKEGADFAKENGYYFKETSCENNTNVADTFETIIIMTNNDMINSGKQNLDEKLNIYEFKEEQGAEKIQQECEYSMNGSSKVPNKKIIKVNKLETRKKKKKNKNCC